MTWMAAGALFLILNGKCKYMSGHRMHLWLTWVLFRPASWRRRGMKGGKWRSGEDEGAVAG